MSELIQMLDQIYDLLDQIYGITTNQTTVFLECRQSEADYDQGLDMIESMVSYKEDLINQLSEMESKFDTAYAPYKGKINEPEQVKIFQVHVKKILDLKKQIVDTERNNVTLMNNMSKNREKRVDIPRQAGEVAAAYKKQQIKS